MPRLRRALGTLPNSRQELSVFLLHRPELSTRVAISFLTVGAFDETIDAIERAFAIPLLIIEESLEFLWITIIDYAGKNRILTRLCRRSRRSLPRGTVGRTAKD